VEETSGVEPEIKDPKAVLSALERAKSDAKKFREEKEELQKSITSLSQKNAEVSGKLLREKTKQTIASMGVKDPDRLIKYVNFSDLDLSDEYEVVGLTDQIDNIKRDLPELFDPKLRVGGQADSAEVGKSAPVSSATERQAKYLLGK
jgi:hypothetical protein